MFFSFSCPPPPPQPRPQGAFPREKRPGDEVAAPPVPLKVVYPGSVTKPCTATLREQGDTKVSQQF